MCYETFKEFLNYLSSKKYDIIDLAGDEVKLISSEVLLEEWRIDQNLPPRWDKKYFQGDICVCGHHYHRHFDTYEDMYPIGCKYCKCDIFESAKIDPQYIKECNKDWKCPFPECDTEPATFCAPSCEKHSWRGY